MTLAELRALYPLAKRGVRLTDFLRKFGFSVIESCPGATQDIMAFPKRCWHLPAEAGTGRIWHPRSLRA